MKIKQLITSIPLYLVASATMAASVCPLPEQIVLVPGEYRWTSREAGWEGRFIAPTHSRGYSTEATRFIEARWIQFSNLAYSPGYVECDYAGNRNDEIIRFVQANYKATFKPNNMNWHHVENLNFPSVQAACSVSQPLCAFEQI